MKSKAAALKALQASPLSCQQYYCVASNRNRLLIYWNGKLSDTPSDEKKKWK